MEDLTGRIFGNIEVLGYNEGKSREATIKYNHKRHMWDCKCIECGSESTRITNELKSILKRNTTGCKQCNLKDLTGLKIGKLTVLGLSEKQVAGKQLWDCLCECGNVVTYQTGVLCKKNPVQSCGCLQKEITSQRNKGNGIRNGDSKKPEFERVYRIWTAMKHRCENSNDSHYNLYGGRGISVCEEWHDWETFKKWSFDNGYQDDLTIDRIDTNGNYEPSNCRWVDMQTQANNTRSNKYITYQGRTQSLADWCRQLGCDYYRVKARINACGYTPEQAFELGKYPAQRINGNKHLGELKPV